MDKNILSTLRKELKEHNLDAILITNPYKIMYLLGIKDSFNLIEVGFYLLITKKGLYLIGDPFSFSLIKTPDGVKKIEESLKALRENRMNPVKGLNTLLKKLRAKKIGLIDRFNLPGYETVSIDDPFIRHFLFPDKKRIDTLKGNAEICNKALEETLKDIKIGVSEIFIRNKIDENIYHFGGERRAFPTKVIFGKNTSNPFSVSNNTRLNDGDPLIINFGLIRSGIGIEVTRSYTIGSSDKNLKELFLNTSNIYSKFLNFLTPGKMVKEVYKYVLEMAKEKGYIDNFLEPISPPLSPNIDGIVFSPNNNSILKPGMLFSTQIGLYFPKKYGIRFQDVIILQDKAVNLTNFLNRKGANVISY